MWEQIKEFVVLIPAIITGLTFVIFAIAWILGHTKSAKLRRAGKVMEDTARTLLDINSFTQKGIEMAEQFIEYSAEDKKQYAVTFIKEQCIKAGISYTDEMINDNIERLISFSKKVNAPDVKRIEATKEEIK